MRLILLISNSITIIALICLLPLEPRASSRPPLVLCPFLLRVNLEHNYFLHDLDKLSLAVRACVLYFSPLGDAWHAKNVVARLDLRLFVDKFLGANRTLRNLLEFEPQQL